MAVAATMSKKTGILRYRADVRPLAFNALYFGILAFLWMQDAFAWWQLPLYAALCVTAFQGAVQTHNAIHCPVFRYKWMNKIYQVVLTNIYGHPVSSYVPGHNLSHHKHTQTRRDVMRTTKVRFKHNLLNGIFFMLSVVPSIMRADAVYSKTMFRRHPKWFRQLLLELSVLVVASVALFVLDWQKALVLWIVPHLYAQWGIVTMNTLQHDGCDGESEWNHSRNFMGKLVNWWVFNNGYHSIHHDIPGLHWSLAPEKHAEQYTGNIHPNLEQKSFVGYIWYTFFLNHRETYDGRPLVLPPEGPDEDWLPRPEDTPDDLGAEAYIAV
jgi:fatty acid desaturase